MVEIKQLLNEYQELVHCHRTSNTYEGVVPCKVYVKLYFWLSLR